MNIIKFLDKNLDTSKYLSNIDIEWYENNVKGKYTYWIHCNFVVAFDDIDDTTYNDLEQENNDYIEGYLDTANIKYLDLNALREEEVDIDSYIDNSRTLAANDAYVYKNYNTYVPAGKYTLDKIKKFRTWLAENLLLYKSNLTDDDKHVLAYYAGGMNDETIDWLKKFGQEQTIYNGTVTTSTCECGSNTNISSLYNTSTSICDPISIYKSNIKYAMINLFSNIDFWKELYADNDDFYDDIIGYVNAIIQANLNLVKDVPSIIETFTCACLTNSNLAQETAISILKSLVLALTNIKDNKTSGIKTDITRTLSIWASDLYELMQWN